MADDEITRLAPPPVFKPGSMVSEARLREDEAEEAKPGMGPPRHQRTEAIAGAVTMLAGFRISHERIARALNISSHILRKYYRFELDNAETQIDAQVLQAWMKNVQKGKEMTILSYMQNKFFKNGIYDPAPPPATDEIEVNEETIRQIAAKINEEYC